MSVEKLKWAAIISFVVSMVVLLGGGYFAFDKVPPYPGKVVDSSGKVLFQKADILAGQDVYQQHGLMDHGMVWGHGSQRGPEFSATTLHLISTAASDYMAKKDLGKPFAELEDLDKDIVTLKVTREIKTNRYDPATDTLQLTPSQVEALGQVEQFWDKTFKEGDKHYGFIPNTVREAKDRLDMGRFFFWTAWAASTKRPGADYTYTNNWPADRSVGNVPPARYLFDHEPWPCSPFRRVWHALDRSVALFLERTGGEGTLER